jgi:hypothetical protein
MRAKKVKPTQLEIITEFAKIDKKINRPQVVNFIKNNANDLYIRYFKKESSYVGMFDGLTYGKKVEFEFSYGKKVEFEKVDPIYIKNDSDFSINIKDLSEMRNSLSLLSKGKDNHIKYYEDELFIGYCITNCYNYVIIAIKK